MKRLFILLICSLGHLVSHAQETDSTGRPVPQRMLMQLSAAGSGIAPENAHSRSIPVSPQSRIFAQHLAHQISEPYGLADIRIPLYEIEIKGMTIPITLSYHTGGIKYKGFDGDIAAGWSISAEGYRATRHVYGSPDEKHSFYDEQTMLNQKSQGGFGWNNYLSMIGTWSSGSTPNYTVAWDGEYDQFSYALPGSGGHFILTGRKPYVAEGMKQNLDKIEFENPQSLESIKITDENGFRYYLGGKTGNVFLGETVNGNSSDYTGTPTSWCLSRIESPYNETVRFSYIRHSVNMNPAGSAKLTITDAIAQLDTNSPRVNDAATYEISTPGAAYDQTFYPTEIVTDKETIGFIRTGSVLNSIEIRDKSGNLVKKINFFYEMADNHRLLSSITVGDANTSAEKYRFEYYLPGYNRTDPLNPVRFYPDTWGYYAYDSDTTRQYSSTNGLFLHEEFLNHNIHKNTVSGVPEVYGIGWAFPELKQYARPRSVVDTLSLSYYSLKKIVYPTGGWTEYEYEPHRTLYFNGGGQRIRKITSKTDASDPSPKVTRFEYGRTSRPIDPLDPILPLATTPSLGSGTGTASIDIRGIADFSNELLYMNTTPFPYGDGSGKYYTVMRTYSTNSLVPEASSLQVYYDCVTRKEYNNDTGSFAGKTVSYYTVPPVMTKNSLFPAHTINPTPPLNGMGRSSVNSYTLDVRPVLNRREVFDTQDRLLQKETYTYENAGTKTFRGFRAARKVFFTPMDYMNPAGFLTEYFTYFQYPVTSYYQRLTGSTVEEYDLNGQNPVSTSATYGYDSQHRVTSVTRAMSNGANSVQQLTYPASGSYLVNAHILTTPVKVKTVNNGVEAGVSETLYGSNLWPSSVRSSATGESYMRTQVTYDRYDTKGNVLQYTSLDGISTVILYSYNSQYPVAVIRNATYAQVQAKSAGNSLINLAGTLNPAESTLLGYIQSLQSQLPEASVTGYVYQPLVGVKTVIDPSGRKSSFQYNPYGQLWYVRDDAGRVLKQYRYNVVNK